MCGYDKVACNTDDVPAKVMYNVHRVSKKQAKLFLLKLRQTSTKSNNFWHKDGKLSKIVWGALIFHLT